jgi:hypothetical protein
VRRVAISGCRPGTPDRLLQVRIRFSSDGRSISALGKSRPVWPGSESSLFKAALGTDSGQSNAQCCVRS